MMYTGATKKVKRPVARSFAPIPIPDPDPDPGMRGKKSLKKGAKTAAGAAAFQNRRKSASTRRPDGFKAAEAQAQEEKRRGSDGNVKKADGKAASGGEEALSRLTSRLGKEGKEMTAKMSEGEMNTLREICDILSGTRLRKVTFKDVAKGEIQRERDSKSRRDRAFASAITAYGRRNYERKEVHPEELELDLDEAIMFAQEKDKHSFKVKAAKAKYLMVFENRAKAEGKEGQGEGEGATAVEKDMKRKKKLRKTPGVWETTQAVKTLIKVKNEWMPHDWDRIMADLRKEGRDIASIDADLKEICRQSTREFGRTQTGKYLMPDDITWCRKHSRFSERDMLKWFRRYRQKCPKGSMSREAFQDLFRTVFPLSSTDVVADIVFEAYDAEKSGELDFKEFLVAIDAVNCEATDEKLRWALSLWDQRGRRVIGLHGTKRVLQLLDQVEARGYPDGTTEDDLLVIQFKKKVEPPKPAEERVDDIFGFHPINDDGTIDLAEMEKTPVKIIYARD